MTAPQHAATDRIRWRKSSHSTGQTDCVEVAQAGGVCVVRDSKDPEAVTLAFADDAWQRFTSGIKLRVHHAQVSQRSPATQQAGASEGPGYVSGPIGSGRIRTSNSGESGQLGRSSATLRHPHFRYAR